MAGTGTTLNLSGYKLTFDDEFNSYDLNNGGTQSGVWNTYFTGFNVRTLSGNGEQEYYSDPSVGVNPFSQQNGELTITASPGSNSAGLPYNSGTINTEGVFSQTYGYFEMRAELPQGKGLWPAFWMLPSDNSWPPELDALEAFGQTNANGEGGANLYHVGAISGNSSQSNGGWQSVSANIYNSYNTYGVMWDPQHVTYYFDGQEVMQITTPSDMNKAMYLIANLAAGGNWPGDPNGETAQMKIDYIRAFSNSSSATAVNLQAISAPDGSSSA
ncbi:MAG: glycoside hydrolase family 16 protein, partial [Alphaproteobacteria bacterium]|nr:glycoside hydrolase family 16 protein [Alphaproteobacteria bacterium]